MDIARPDIAHAHRRRKVLWIISVSIFVILVTVALSRLKPAVPSVERSAIVLDTIKRGGFPRQVRGNGNLAPVEILWIPAQSQGRVERINVLPGAEVKADTVLIELSNPELDQTVLESEWQLKAAEAEGDKMRLDLESQRLTQEASVATIKENYTEAKEEAEIDESFVKDGLVSEITRQRSRAKADDLKNRYEIEKKRLDISEKLVGAQISSQQAKIEQLRGQLRLKQQLVESLKIRAGIDGVLQKLGDTDSIQVGQQLQVSANVARVAIPTRLKAEIKIPETQAKDVQLGQNVAIDTRNGIVQGKVARVDPTVISGTVTVDVTLVGDLPKGARPDLSVDGTIELETLSDVLYTGRPSQGQTDSISSIFKVINDGKEAVRTQVKLGRNSVNYIEVIEGLKAGDQVILSDMSQWDAYDRIRLK